MKSKTHHARSYIKRRAFSRKDGDPTSSKASRMGLLITLDTIGFFGIYKKTTTKKMEKEIKHRLELCKLTNS